MKTILTLALAALTLQAPYSAAFAQDVSDAEAESGPVIDAEALPSDQPKSLAQVDPIKGLAGPYLAARAAAVNSDFRAAAEYYDAALKVEATDPVLQDSALVAMISSGQVGDAVRLADQTKSKGDPTQLAGLVLRADMARNDRWDDLLAAVKDRPTAEAEVGGGLLDSMAHAWALMGAGKAKEAMAAFEKLERSNGAEGIARYHLGLAKASVGDYEGAEKLLSDPRTGGHLLGIIARAQVLSQLERDADALKIIDALDGVENEPALAQLRQQLANGERVPFTAITSPKDGIAQVFLTFATALSETDEPDPLALIHARLAEYLAPNLGEARLMVAQLLQQVGQFDLANKEFDALREMGDMRPVAELARIDTLARAERPDDAEKAARTLTEARPDLAPAWIALGDLLRQNDRWTDAVSAYDRALEILQKSGDPQQTWFPLYARGIALERAGQFDRADADMRAALALQPNQAPILNYLGYSWVDRNINLDEGLALIQKAVDLRPEDGYILDSLGWAYYRLGRFDEAVDPMERAVTMMSDDSVVNDHMGDVYWKVNRKREAEIQWRRALSLWKEGDDVSRDRIRAKLEVGLDEVAKAEAANGGKLPDGFGLPPEPPAPVSANDTTSAPATTPATNP